MSSLHQTRLETAPPAIPAGHRYRNPRSSGTVATNPSPQTVNSETSMSIALIGPEDGRRSAAAMALTGCGYYDVTEFPAYPPGMDDVSKMLEEKYDVVIIDLDSDPEYALELLESMGGNGHATLMVYSENADPEVLVRCMRAGAREFLTLPFAQDMLTDALVRAAARRPLTRSAGKAEGKLLAFMGAKGGAGATTLACNFAVALAEEKSQKTILIDLDLPLGDAALNLGITAEFSTIDALRSADRLDGSFLTQLLVQHSSGLAVLAAPGRFLQYEAGYEAIDRLINVARLDFDNVVVDLGSRLDLMTTAAYKDATAIYLVTQASIPELRNSNRLIGQFFSGPVPKLEVVINRFEPRVLGGVSEEHISKALTRSVQWKIPNDYASVRKMQINATPLVMADSAITRQIRLMAKAAIGESATAAAPAKKKGFRLFG
jgi:pilus assembly protein CpaE